MTLPAFSKPLCDPVLAVCGVEDHLQLVLGEKRDGAYKSVYSSCFACQGKMIETMATAVAHVLEINRLKPSDLAAMACVRGPGSFTGIRITLACVQAMCMGAGIPLMGLENLELVARKVCRVFQKPAWVFTYARRGIVYARHFTFAPFTPETEIMVLPVDQAAELVRGYPPHVLAGSGVDKNLEKIRQSTAPDISFLPGGEFSVPDSCDVMAACNARAACGGEIPSEPVEPLYIRATDAEDNLAHISRLRGLDPDETKKRLFELKHRLP